MNAKDKLVRTIRVRNRHEPGVFGQLATAIGDQQAPLGNISTVALTSQYTVRDLDVLVDDETHLQRVLAAIATLPDSQVHPHADAGAGPGDDAAQAADVARAAALAERRRLTRDLHDSVTQTLISLHLTAQAAAELWDTQPAPARAALEAMCHLASGAATEMRALLVDLHDTVLEQHGLVAALEVHCAVVRERSGLPVALHVAEVG